MLPRQAAMRYLDVPRHEPPRPPYHPMSVTSLPRPSVHVLLLENIHATAGAVFEAEGFRVERISGALKEAELADKLQSGVHFLGIRSKTRIHASTLAKADQLQAIGAFCIGVNQVDLVAANARGIPVFNAPFSNTRSVAEMIIGEIVFLAPADGRPLARGARRQVAQDLERLRRGARQDARHRWLRAHRLTGGRARRVDGDAGRLVRHPFHHGHRQRARGRFLGRAFGRGRLRHAARPGGRRSPRT